MGTALFDRSRRPLGLTPAGEAYIRAVERMKYLEDDLGRELEDLHDLRTGRLHIGGTHYLNCFLLVEGFQKTRNLKKYIMRLGIFAVIAEVPFDLCFTSRAFSLSHQSVMLTLLVGVITMWLVSLLERHVANRFLLVPCAAVVIALGAAAAELMNTDYGYMGVLCIMTLYVLRREKWMQITGGCLVFLWEIWAPIAFIPIGFYNGERGLRLKYIFYLFYPLHLLILYLICVWMGTGDIPAV